MPVVHINDIDIAYQEQGSGPPVILLHGGFLDGSHFEKNIPALAQRYRVIAYDRRGCGGSSRDVPQTGEIWTEDLRQIVWTLAGGSAYLVGSSYGGLTVMELLAHHPEMVKGAIISAARGSGFRGPEPPFVEFGNRLPDLATIDVPLRVIHGADDTGCPPQLGEEVANAARAGEFVLVADAGHNVHRHKPEQWNAAALEFLDRVSGR